MTEIRKRIAALTIAASMLIGTTGCSQNSIWRSIDALNKATYEGDINLEGLDYLYIIEIKDLKGNKDLYLTKRDSLKNILGGYKYKILGTSILLTQSDDANVYTSDLGEVINVIPFKQFWAVYYNEVTQSDEIVYWYSAQEIIDIYELVKKDYDKLMTNENVKKLELKK